MHAWKRRDQSHEPVGDCYRFELDDAQHAQLLDTLRTLDGMVILCGYPSPLYNDRLVDWEQVRRQSRIAGQNGTAMRTEALWLNPACSAALTERHQQQELIA